MAVIRKPKRPKASASMEKCVEYAQKLDAFNKAVSQAKAEKETKKRLLKGDLSALKGRKVSKKK